MKKLLVASILGIIMATQSLTVSAEEKAEVSEQVKIKVLGTSDVHGFLMPWDYSIDGETTRGSLSQVSTYVKEVRENNENVVLVDVGDIIQGNSVELFTTSESHPAMKVLNYLKYDYFVLGNHEFDYGLENLVNITSQFKGEVLTGNLYINDGREISIPYDIVEIDGLKIAFVGMTTPMTMEFKKDTDLVNQIKLTDPVEETKKVVAELDGKVDAIIGVMHMGQDNENNVPNTGVNDIISAVPQLDAVIGGHMHKDVPQEVVNTTIFTEPGVYARQISEIDMTFVVTDGEVVLKEVSSKTVNSADYERDLEFEKVIEEEHNLAQADANQAIGKIAGVELVPENEIEGIQYGFFKWTPLTKLFTEAQFYYSDADVVTLLSELNPRLDTDTISKKDIAFNYTYAGGETTIYEVTGKDLKEYMEWSADYYNTLKEGDIHPSFNPDRRSSKYSTYDVFDGVFYKIDLTEESGNRIKELRNMKTGELIQEEDVLKLGMNAYRMNQLLAESGIFEGREFKQLWTSTDEYGEEDGTIRGMAMNYIKEANKGFAVLKNEPNWLIEGYDENTDVYKAFKFLVNEGAVKLVNSEDGKYTNLKSFNELEVVEEAFAQEVIKNLNISNIYEKDMTVGEFFVKAHNVKVNGVEVVEKPTKPSDKEEVNTIKITIKYGDTLKGLAKKYNNNVETLVKLNDVKNPNLIYEGHTLLVPVE